ncbi:carboxypeptidase-like regulatory domain-containing protein [Runella sp. SP2]|uniref:carboxypeptidase-like regulatory domain-containing protein n=1 Tax=Runella sp. SP2 TaxID=2268026 RepID=UPI000F0946C4|nr:carboxypeptidase-like regulatory domain-containing protein [Runella sp. SP2]AYQ33456.1 carboxypeptidase regulatory-like domain-containing protein [Runella sp. SP2]
MTKSTLTALFFLLAGLLVMSCEVTPMNPDNAQPYTISGTVKDAAGNPIRGARIRVENPNGNNIHYTATTNEAGKYSVTVSAIGGYKIYAWKESVFEDQLYQIRLGMEKESDYDAFNVPASGTTKDFVWKLSGRIPDRVASKENGTGYFGGTIKFINYNAFTDEMPAGTEVSVLFTPVAEAKYLDGTSAVGKTIERKFTIASGVGQAYYLNDIPATKYKITVSSLKNGVKKAVHVASGSSDEFLPSAEYYFKPEGGSGSYENGLISPNEYYYYLMNK